MHPILIGFLVGSVIATIGWHRERKFEEFSIIAWFRSVIVATAYGSLAWFINLSSYIRLPIIATILTACFVATFERLTLEFYKTYIKADYKPHVICKICHCNLLRVHGRYFRPKNQKTRLERRLTSASILD